MALYDSNGYPVWEENKFAKAAIRGVNKPWEKLYIGDIDDLIPEWDWKTILSASRKLFTNLGLSKGAVLQKACYSVGRAWDPVSKSKDSEWSKLAETWLKDEFYKVCDVRGPTFNFKTNLFIDSLSLDRDGGYFVLLTETKTGYPQFQRIGAHRIGQRDPKQREVEKGKFKGKDICKGVITNKIGRPIAYRVLGDDKDGKDDKDISTSYIIHGVDPHWYEQKRGIPAGTHAIDKLLRSVKTEEYEEMALQMLASIGLIEYNDYGMADEQDPNTFLTSGGGTDQSGITTVTHHGGMTKYFKANSGGNLKTIDSKRPGPEWESFQNRIAKSYIVGMGWSYPFVWDPKQLNGTANRAELEKVRRSTSERQDVLEGPANRMIVYAIAKAIKLGILPHTDDWWKWGFTKPPKISIDPGRDSKADLDNFKAGRKNMTQLLSEDGRTYEDHVRERANEVVTRKRIQAEVEEESGIQIDDREMIMYTPNEQPEEEDEDDVS